MTGHSVCFEKLYISLTLLLFKLTGANSLDVVGVVGLICDWQKDKWVTTTPLL